MTTPSAEAVPSPSRRIAREIRAELARQGISKAALAVKMDGVSYAWVNRRLALGGDVEISFEDLDKFAEALRVSPQSLLVASGWLPRLDSNQQPSD